MYNVDLGPIVLILVFVLQQFNCNVFRGPEFRLRMYSMIIFN